MQNGCKRDICVNVFCKNNPNFKVPANSQELLKNAMNLWKDYNDLQKYKYWEICCDTDLMKDTGKSL